MTFKVLSQANRAWGCNALIEKDEIACPGLVKSDLGVITVIHHYNKNMGV